jgi:hypothetical protein
VHEDETRCQLAASISMHAVRVISPATGVESEGANMTV